MTQTVTGRNLGKEPTARAPFHVMVKPIGSKCNLDCKYCFYLEKEALFASGEKWRMDGELLRNYIRRHLEAHPVGPVVFAWQGGEPTLLGVEFFENAVLWQKEFLRGHTIENAFQTNGTLLDDEWGAFLKREDFLVGISLDGPERVHDASRVNCRGGGTHADVMRGLAVLKRHRVEFNTLTCVNRFNSDSGVEIYEFLKRAGARHLQFIPVVERLPDAAAERLGLSHATPPVYDGGADGDGAPHGPMAEWSVRPKDYGRFMWSLFKRWVREDVGRIHVQFFETALAKWVGEPGGLCVFAEECGRALALEHDGSLYSCDHYVYPDYKIGNLRDRSLTEMVDGEGQAAFGRSKSANLPDYCRQCEFRFACNGGCPKHRFMLTPGGEPGLNYLCGGYRFLFGKMRPYLEAMAGLYRSGQSPTGVMGMIRNKRLPRPA